MQQTGKVLLIASLVTAAQALATHKDWLSSKPEADKESIRQETAVQSLLSAVAELKGTPEAQRLLRQEQQSHPVSVESSNIVVPSSKVQTAPTPLGGAVPPEVAALVLGHSSVPKLQEEANAVSNRMVKTPAHTDSDQAERRASSMAQVDESTPQLDNPYLQVLGMDNAPVQAQPSRSLKYSNWLSN